LPSVPAPADIQAILVVDDEPDILTVLCTHLSTGRELSVASFSNPKQALEHFKEKQDYALVVSDIRMPEMNGIELAKQIKIINPQTKVLLMSAFDVVSLDLGLGDTKIDGFLRKPFGIREFTDMIDRLLQGKR
jgi:DNA-binding NtrC family response regulator